MNSYGGGGCARGAESGWSRQDPPEAMSAVGQQVGILPASTYTPEEARMAEQYARDAMADANWPSDENAHRVWRT